MLQNLSAIAQILTSFVVAVVAIIGINTWRRQRDAELGEETIRHLYEAREIIRASRYPEVILTEKSYIKDPVDCLDRRAPAQHLLKHTHVFVELETIRGIFSNRFGGIIEQHFSHINEAKERLMAYSMIEAMEDNNPNLPGNTIKKINEVTSRPSDKQEKDEFLDDLNQAIAAIEAICREKLLRKKRWWARSPH